MNEQQIKSEIKSRKLKLFDLDEQIAQLKRQEQQLQMQINQVNEQAREQAYLLKHYKEKLEALKADRDATD